MLARASEVFDRVAEARSTRCLSARHVQAPSNGARLDWSSNTGDMASSFITPHSTRISSSLPLGSVAWFRLWRGFRTCSVVLRPSNWSFQNSRRRRDVRGASALAVLWIALKNQLTPNPTNFSSFLATYLHHSLIQTPMHNPCRTIPVTPAGPTLRLREAIT
uniref:Uncharacterized protein n=1 Tax=Mycena chlorophos TaxID=658473 RepID=A0ABQ0L0X1_MYCCL|nr:predicted protein [Mycena chlorophos]